VGGTEAGTVGCRPTEVEVLSFGPAEELSCGCFGCCCPKAGGEPYTRWLLLGISWRCNPPVLAAAAVVAVVVVAW